MDRDATMTFRLRTATRAALEEAAEAEQRSLSSLAVVILEGWLTDRGYLPKPSPRAAKRRGGA
ncbi:MAG TPA: hypothetical protein VEB43_04580 [Anaeromyxobacter sp.]|nr:hypothetical protein [Anaeromyxobacter sp.]